MDENMASEGYCCAKPTDEELEAATIAAQIANANVERLHRVTRDHPAMLGGTRKALNADAIVVLHADGTYEVAKNRHAGLQLGRRVEELTVLYLGYGAIATLTSETRRVRKVKAHVKQASR